MGAGLFDRDNSFQMHEIWLIGVVLNIGILLYMDVILDMINILD